jgi:hypothetical protein
MIFETGPSPVFFVCRINCNRFASVPPPEQPLLEGCPGSLSATIAKPGNDHGLCRAEMRVIPLLD